MKFKEIFNKLFSPKPIGTVDLKGKNDRPYSKYTLLHFSLALLIIVGLEYLFFNANVDELVSFILLANLVLLIYILISSLIRVQPNYENLGWVPFLVNDPFRISDNVNRFLIFLQVMRIKG
ncbi:MAG: hypothetical protein Sapg2KO_42670 [Saprospiraceae bacterium]